MKKLLFNLGLLTAFISLSSFLIGKNYHIVPEQKSLLWKVEGNGLTKPSYLFGTMHIIEKDYFYFPKTLEKYVAKSDVVVMEIANLDQAEAMQHFMLKEGTLFDFFTKEQSDSLIQWVKKNTGMDEEMFRATFKKMKPFVVLQTVTQVQFIGKTESYEKTISDIAIKKKIKTLGLETIEDQIGIFDRLTKEQQTELVMEGIRNENSSSNELKKMQELYRSQYIDSLYLYIAHKESVIASEEEAFLKDRNHKWIPKIKDIMKDQSAFIAVGAGHLGGQTGVIKLLEKEGYIVTPVKF